MVIQNIFNTKYHRRDPSGKRNSKTSWWKATSNYFISPDIFILIQPPPCWWVNLKIGNILLIMKYLKPSAKFRLTDFNDIIDIKPSDYRNLLTKEFHIKRALAKIKTLLLD